MENYQYYIDDIQGAVFSPETADPEFLRDSAAMYAEACAEINDRLRQVARLLSRGLRSEAIQLAEEEPNLLDQVAVLDFPELQAWCDMLREWGMATPPPLLIELAADINQAYADQQPIDALLKQHRLFALARAPLSARIDTLRRIIESDDSNEASELDLTNLEKARLKEIGAEADVAFRRCDLNTLQGIAKEVKDVSWTIPVPTSLSVRIEGLATELARSQAMEELTKIEQELNRAHMAFDSEVGRKQRARWVEKSAIAMLLPDSDLASRAAPALDWLAELDQTDDDEMKRQHAFRILEEALDVGSSPEEIDRFYQTAMRFEESMPLAIKSRAEHYLEGYAVTQKRKHRIILTTVVGTLLVLGTLVIFFTMEQAHSKAVNACAATIEALIEEDRLEEAEQYFNEVAESSPEVVSSPEVQQQRAALLSAQESENDRRRSFERLISQAEASSANTPDREVVTQAKQIARSREENQRVAQLEKRINQAKQEKRRSHDLGLAERIDQLRGSLKEVEANSESLQTLSTESLLELRQSIQEAKKKFPSASSTVSSQTKPLLKRISTLLTSVNRENEAVELRDKIASNVGDVSKFLLALTAFAEAQTDSALAKNLDLLNKESRLWIGLIAWNTFLEDQQWNNFDLVTAEQARKTLNQGRDLKNRFGDLPSTAHFDAISEYLESITAREPEGEDSLIESLQKLMRDPLIRKLYMVETDGGLRYYCRKKPDSKPPTIKFKYLAGFDLKEKTSTAREEDVTYNALSPQSRLADKCSRLLEDANEKGWERSLTSILLAVEAQDDLEPILKTILLKRILKSAIEGSTVLAQGFEDYYEELDELAVDLSVPWMNPRNQAARQERTKAEVGLDSLPDLKKAVRATASRLKELNNNSSDSFQWVGWLSRARTGRWRVLGERFKGHSGDLVVLLPGEAEKQARIEKIGTINNGEALLRGYSHDSLLVGRPVFVRD